MPIRDSWHRTLVYFGLAEDERPGYFDDTSDHARLEPEAVIEERYRERPNVRRLSSRRRRDEFDDIFADDEPPTRANLRPIGGGAAPAKARNGSVKLHLVIPKSFNDAQQVAD